MSNSLDPDEGPDLGPNCLPRLISADGTGRERVKNSRCKKEMFKIMHHCDFQEFLLQAFVTVNSKIDYNLVKEEQNLIDSHVSNLFPSLTIWLQSRNAS